MPPRWLLIVLAALGGAALLASRLRPRRLIFPAPAPRALEPPEGTRLVEIEGQSGRRVYALEAPPPAGAPVVVLFHGNAEQLADQTAVIEGLRTRGLGVLAVEYPGYGPAAAYSPSERAIYEDAAAAIAWLRRTRRIEPQRIVLLGRSLGTGVAVEMAARGLGARVVLISPYTSIPALARLHVSRSLPLERLIEDRFDTLAKANRIAQPVLLIHGETDALIPIAMSETLARTFAHATLWRLAGVDHNTVYSADPHALFDRIAAFAHRARTIEENE